MLMLLIPVVCCGLATSDEAPWGASQNGLATRLTLVTQEPTLGKPLKVKLEVKNTGTAPAQFDDQQAAVNNSLEVKGPDGAPVPHIGMSTQTLGSMKAIQPGEVEPIFLQLDVTEQYLIEKPGKYTLSFRTHHWGKLPKSNELTVTIKDGPLSDRTQLVAACHKAMPAGWRVAVHGDEISFLSSPTNLKRDVAVITIFFTKEQTTDRKDAESLGKTRFGNAWVEFTPKKYVDRWPEYKKCVEEHVKPFRVQW